MTQVSLLIGYQKEVSKVCPLSRSVWKTVLCNTLEVFVLLSQLEISTLKYTIRLEKDKHHEDIYLSFSTLSTIMA